MYLWQKYNYHLHVLKDDGEFIGLANRFRELKPDIVVFDTESTGLNTMVDIPFLVGIGFAKQLYVFEPSTWRLNFIYDLVRSSHVKYFLAHNAKFDYHMLRNAGAKIPDYVNIADTYSMARLTNYVDSLGSLALVKLADEHIDPMASFGEKAIREHINQLNGERLKKIREYVRDNDVPVSYTEFRKLYDKRVKYVPHELDEHFMYVDLNFPEITYKDSYIDKPTLMINYLADDLLMVIELYKVLTPVLDIVDVGRKTWHRENSLIPIYAEMESQGMRLDIKYLLKSRVKIMDYMDKVYDNLWETANIKDMTNLGDQDGRLLRNNPKFSVGQHQVIKDLFAKKYRIGMLATDESALKEIMEQPYPEDAKTIASNILELRTLSKWLSTYIEGKLNRELNGKLYTDINISGTVTGRVSSDLQQEPQEPIYTADGKLLFNPRRAFINEDGYNNFYLDFSNMELRVQAYYTMLTSEGDLNLCRAFIPFKCKSIMTGDEYNPQKDYNMWDEPVWVDESNSLWTKTDLHSVTTLKAFPNISPDAEDFGHYRNLGKRANFLKNYGGGLKALQTQLRISYEVAQALDKGYYEAFPKVLDYQRWVEQSISSYGYVENLYGRRYYFKNTGYSYRGYNYLIQGSSADYLKVAQLELHEYLKDKKSKMLMPIHDEMIFKIADGEEHIVKDLKAIMENGRHIITTIPMVVDVEFAKHNWSELEGYNV